MKKTRSVIIIGLTLLLGQIQAQTFELKGTLGTAYNFQVEHYRTTVDFGGVQAVAKGTAQNIINGVTKVKGIVGNIFGNNNDNPTITTEGNATWYTYRDKVLKEEKILERRIIPQIGAEIGLTPLKNYLAIGVGASTGKYKYLAIDAHGYINIFPYAVFGKGRQIITGFTPQKGFLNRVYIGAKFGNDTSYPGFLFLKDKTYKGIALGGSVLFWEDAAEIRLGVFLDTKKREDTDIRQSNFNLSLLFPLTKRQ